MAHLSGHVPLMVFSIQIAKYVKEHPGCTGADVKKRFRLPLHQPSMMGMLRPIGPADSMQRGIEASYVYRLVQSRFLRTDRGFLGSENSSHLWLTSAGEEALESHANRVIEILKYIRDKGSCSVGEIGEYWQSLPPKASTADILMHKSRVLDYNLSHYERISPLKSSGLVELDGGLAENRHTLVKLTEKGLAALANGPRSILRTLYGPA